MPSIHYDMRHLRKPFHYCIIPRRAVCPVPASPFRSLPSSSLAFSLIIPKSSPFSELFDRMKKHRTLSGVFFRLGSELRVRTVAKGGIVCVLTPAKQRRTAFYSGKRHPAGVGRPEVGLVTEWLTAAQSTGAVEIFLTGLQMNLNGRIRRDDNVGLFSIRSHSFLSQLRQSGQSPSTMIRWRLTRYPVSSSICKSISFR